MYTVRVVGPPNYRQGLLKLPLARCPILPRLTGCSLGVLSAQTCCYSWPQVDLSFAGSLAVQHADADHTRRRQSCAPTSPDLALRSFEYEAIAQLIIQRSSTSLIPFPAQNPKFWPLLTFRTIRLTFAQVWPAPYQTNLQFTHRAEALFAPIISLN